MSAPKKTLILGVKDANGAYIPVTGAEITPPAAPVQEPTPYVGVIEDDLDCILKAQITALSRLTRAIATDIANSRITKETANQLSTCIKITMELKAKQQGLLDDLDEDELIKKANEP